MRAALVLLLVGCACGRTSLFESLEGVDGGCGDGVVTPPEACDDSNRDDTDACLSSCRPASCGDGFVRARVELCDPADSTDGAVACTANCTVPSCGNAVLDAPEV